MTITLYLIINVLLCITVQSVKGFITPISTSRVAKPRNFLAMLDVDASTVVLGLAAAGGLGAFSIYSKVAIETAGVISGIPVESDIVELGALDGKNVFYLPPGCDYTAIMAVEESDIKKRRIKLP